MLPKLKVSHSHVVLIYSQEWPSHSSVSWKRPTHLSCLGKTTFALFARTASAKASSTYCTQFSCVPGIMCGPRSRVFASIWRTRGRTGSWMRGCISWLELADIWMILGKRVSKPSVINVRNNRRPQWHDALWQRSSNLEVFGSIPPILDIDLKLGEP